MTNLINQPDFMTGLDDLNFPMDALERCTSNPLVRCYSNLSCTSSQNGGATFVPFGRGQECLDHDYIDVSLLLPPAAVAVPVPVQPPPPLNLSAMKISDLIGMNVSLKELLDHDLICRLFKDQNGSRYVQERLGRNVSSKMIDDVLKHIIFKKRKLLPLAVDVYGNYVIQMFFEIGNRRQRKLLCDNLLCGNVYRLSHSFYGCRVIQKALDFISTQQCTQLVQELNNKLIDQCVIGQNSNHVLQKVLSLKLKRKDIEFVIDCIRSDLYLYSTHMFGCRIVQSIINHYGQVIIKEIVTDNALILALSSSEYGNYVVQDILSLNGGSKSVLRLGIFENVVILSKNKFGSNVVEKCLGSSTDKERDFLLKQVIKNKSILKSMVQDRYANFVIQKLLTHSNHKQQSKLIYLIGKNIPNLRSLPYGKHISDKIRKIKHKYKSECTHIGHSVYD